MTKNTEIKILYVEDIQDDVDLMLVTLRKSSLSVDLETVAHLDELKAKLVSSSYDLIITDYNLRGYNGEDVIKMVRDFDEIIPIIIFTGTVGEEVAVRLIQQGASDFYLKESIKLIPKAIIKLIDHAELRRKAQTYKDKHTHQSNILEAIFYSITDFLFLKNDQKRYLKVNKSMADILDITEENFEGKNNQELNLANYFPDSDRTDDEVLNHGKVVRYEVDIVNNEGRRMVLETVKSPIKEKGVITGLVGLSRDITAKKVFNEELHKNQQILDRAEQITRSASFEYDPDTDMITASSNFKKLMNLGQGPQKFSLKRFTQLIYEADLPLFVQELDEALHTKSQFEMEIRYGKANDLRYGKILIFPDLSLEKTLFYGTVVDTTIERKSYLGMDQVQERERKVISRELHDNIGQKLTAAKMFLNHLSNNGDTHELIHKLSALIEDSITDIRGMSRELSIKLVEENGLQDALIQLVNFIPDTLRVELDLDFDDEVISRHVAGNLYRIVQEALNNTLKYAKAKNFYIHLQQYEQYLELKLSDDGKGFDLEKKLGYGNGLKNIEQRVKTCNGVIKIDTGKHLGTTITVKLPPN